MTYIAPRQGLFAIIIILSFFLHTLLLVITTEQQVNEMYRHTGERVVEQFIQESSLAFSSHDTVSLSVLANRYTSEFDIAGLIIRDTDDSVLVRVGDTPLEPGQQITRSASLGDAELGEVTLMLKQMETGEIISSQWFFLLGSVILHLFIWLLYGYTARPTKKQLSALSRDIQEHLQIQVAPAPRARRGESNTSQHDPDDQNKKSNLSINDVLIDGVNSDRSNGVADGQQLSDRGGLIDQQMQTSQSDEDYSSSIRNFDIQQAVNNYVKNHKGGAASEVEQSKVDNVSNASTQTDDDISMNKTASNKTGSKLAPQGMLVANRSMQVVTLQINYDDKDNLLATLAPEKSQPYFALCTQLLQQTIVELLKQPLLNGVTLDNQPKFDESGAKVQLRATDDYSKIGLAAVMLGRSFVMLNQIIYSRHRELRRFALKAKVGVSDEALVHPMSQLLHYHAKTDDILVLLPKAGFKQLNSHIQLRNLRYPTTVYERECAVVTGVDENMMQRLVDVRNSVLLSGQ